MTKWRIKNETGWKQERVWCVKSVTGFIVTRRNGTVTITGNTEGFDAPSVELIAIGRPTKSRALYTQCVGRGTRPLPGVVDGLETAQQRVDAIAGSRKPNCTVLDFVGQSGRHSLVCTTDILAGSEPDEIKDRANHIASDNGFDGTTLEAIQQAREELAAEREARRHKVTVGVDYTLQEASTLYDLSAIPSRRGGNYLTSKPISEKQRAFAIKLGYTASQVLGMNQKTVREAIDYAIENPKTSVGRWVKKQKAKESADARRG